MGNSSLSPEVLQNYPPKPASRLQSFLWEAFIGIIVIFMVLMAITHDSPIVQLMLGGYFILIGLMLYLRPAVVDWLQYQSLAFWPGRPGNPSYEDRVRRLERQRIVLHWFLPLFVGGWGLLVFLSALYKLLS
jgi:hypothetical protein